MSLEPEMLKSLVKAAAEQVIASTAELTALDQAIGDGDHGANMKRGFEAVLGKLDAIAGLPPGEAAQVFEKFVRGKNVAPGRGIGLGLAVARSIVEAHGGRIWAESAPGRGTTVSLTLPQSAAE